MPSKPLARAGLHPRGIVAALVFALLLAAAAPASAVTRRQAAKKALTALGSAKRSGPVIVFALRKPLRAGTKVTQSCSGRRVAKVGRRKAFFVYEDRAPFQLAHNKG